MSNLQLWDHSICALDDATARLIQHFRPEIERRITQRGGDLGPIQEAAA